MRWQLITTNLSIKKPKKHGFIHAMDHDDEGLRVRADISESHLAVSVPLGPDATVSAWFRLNYIDDSHSGYLYGDGCSSGSSTGKGKKSLEEE